MLDFKKRVEKLRYSNEYPIVNLKIFDSIEHLDLSNRVLNNNAYAKEDYKEYLYEINSLDSTTTTAFLNAAKGMEVVDCRTFDNYDTFFTWLNKELGNDNTIDFLIKNTPSEKENFIEGHKILLRDTPSAHLAEQDYRQDNYQFVGYTENNDIFPFYFPIDHNDIDEAIERLLNFYKSEKYDDELFVKTEILHGLIATLQLFGDGNTRYGRIIKSIKLHELTKKEFDHSFESPALYGTRAYFMFRPQYRKLITNIAENPNNDTWNEWINFNINRVQDTLFLMNDKVEQTKIMKISRG